MLLILTSSGRESPGSPILPSGFGGRRGENVRIVNVWVRRLTRNRTDQDALALWKYFTNATCNVTPDPTEPCTLGYYGVYVILAKERDHIKAGVDFAREHNLRLVIRNTGHDFIGRSVGWGSLVINTHSFQEVEFLEFEGPGEYQGQAVRIGAGVQGRELAGAAAEKGLAVVTGECPVSVLEFPGENGLC